MDSKEFKTFTVDLNDTYQVNRMSSISPGLYYKTLYDCNLDTMKTLIMTILYNDFTYNMVILITLNTDEIPYNVITYDNSKCNITYMFLWTVISKVIYK